VISPIAREAVRKMDDIFALEREFNGLPLDRRLAVRRETIAPLVKELIDWMAEERATLSGHNDVAKAMDYMLKQIDAFTRFLDDGRICLTNNAAERSRRGIAIGRSTAVCGIQARWRACGSAPEAAPAECDRDGEDLEVRPSAAASASAPP
jgi:hypothetical protein